jgi:CheY-like chemotaxis protein
VSGRTSVLERAGFHVHAVNDGREGLDALHAKRYDAVLMDCQMPDLDGYEATRSFADASAASGARP